jgi:tight adherence protein B
VSDVRRVWTVLAALAAVAAPALPATAQAAPAAPATVIIVLDTSGSMRGARGETALEAAGEYLGALPPDVPAGLVTFSGGATLVVPPTVDRGRLAAALGTRWNATRSPLYDAVALAARTIDRLPGTRRLLILSDGDDTGSSRTPGAVAAQLARSRITADLVALDHRATAGGRDRIVRATGGRVLEPADVAARAAELASAPAPVVTAPAVWPLRAGLASLGLAALGVLAVVLRRVRSRRRPRWQAALERYGQAPRLAAAADEHAARHPAPSALVRAGDRLLGARGRRERLATQLDLAGMPLRPAEWLLVRIGICAGLGLLAVLVGASWPGALAGVAAGWLAGRQYLRFRIARRRGAFADQLPDTLQLVVGALKAGFSLPQALNSVVREDTQPIAGEFARALATTRLGTSVEDALDRTAERMRSKDFAWVVMAIRIQRQVGGNLSELLQTTVHTMRERSQLRRHVKGLTAEGRLSAYVLIGLPVLLALWMFVSRRAYLAPLYSTGAGWVMIITAVGCVSAGWFWMSRLSKVEV